VLPLESDRVHPGLVGGAQASSVNWANSFWSEERLLLVIGCHSRERDCRAEKSSSLLNDCLGGKNEDPACTFRQPYAALAASPLRPSPTSSRSRAWAGRAVPNLPDKVMHAEEKPEFRHLSGVARFNEREPPRVFLDLVGAGSIASILTYTTAGSGGPG
jgi:hypothetical protein